MNASVDDASRGQDPYRTFRGRFTTPVAWSTGVILVAGCVFVALLGTAPGAQDPVNQVSIIVTGLFFGVLTVRFAGVRADPDPEGIRVVNYVRARRLSWAEIVTVRFAPGDPWVHLDLADGSVLAVMAIQRSDGEHAMAEARRLVSLIAEHGEGREPDADPGPPGG